MRLAQFRVAALRSRCRNRCLYQPNGYHLGFNGNCPTNLTKILREKHCVRKHCITYLPLTALGTELVIRQDSKTYPWTLEVYH